MLQNTAARSKQQSITAWLARLQRRHTYLRRQTLSVTEVAGLDVLPDDVLLQIIALAGVHNMHALFVDVNGLGCCKDMLQQLYRLRPIVSVQVKLTLPSD